MTKQITILVFVLVYLTLSITKKYRIWVIWSGIAFLLPLGAITAIQIPQLISWNVLGVLTGTAIVAELFTYSQVPAYLADKLILRIPTVGMAIVVISLLAGLVSAFVDNVSTVLIIAPVALMLAQRLNVSPVPFILGIAVSSNLQGSATLVGDPPSMILGQFAGLNFNDFFIFQGKPGMFFIVQLAAIVSGVVLLYIFRRHREPVIPIPQTEVKSWIPTVLLLGMIFTLAIVSALHGALEQYLHYEPSSAVICLFYGFLGLVYNVYTRGKEGVLEIFAKFDWETVFFLAGIFILVGSLTVQGVITDLATFLQSIVGNNVFLTFTILVWLSVFISAFVDNIPYVLAMLPVAQYLANAMSIQPYLFYFGLLIGATIGGNITPIGASANIVACGILKKQGYQVSFGEFMKIGLPFTFFAVLAGYLFLWFVYR